MNVAADLAKIEKDVLGGLRAFQRATVEQIAATFRKNGGKAQRCFLLADEVGLGKTLVARGAIAAMARIRLEEEDDDLFKVVYVCSNQNIARQNLAKLRIGPTENSIAKENPVDSVEARLSMQHLLAEEREISCKKSGFPIQLVAITPETSFRMGNREGRKEERALICAILSGMREFKSHRKKLSSRLKGTRIGDDNSWKDLVRQYEDRIAEVHSAHRSYPGCIYDALRRHGGDKAFRIHSVVDKLFSDRSGRNFGDCISALRRMFADVSVDRIEPDLVVMDEFQRFRYLLQSKNDPDDETGILARRFLTGSVPEKQPRVLLLSATPFKPYSTKEEVQCAGSEESLEGFREVANFLFPERKRQITSVWDDYRVALARFAAKRKSGVRPPDKTEVEAVLRDGICRTERTLARTQSIVASTGASGTTVLPDEREIRAYAAVARLARETGGAGLPRIEQAKSVPYLLSFRGSDNYVEQDRFEKAVKGKRKGRILDSIPKEDRDVLWIDPKKVRRYGELPFSNSRLALLAEHAFAKTRGIAEEGANATGKRRTVSGPEFCLWLPPAFPCYPPAGPFADAVGYSKTLAFSSWEMVPKMIASLLSYEADRRTIVPCYGRNRRPGTPRLDYRRKDDKRYPLPRLEFTVKNRKPGAMSLFALMYPSRTLADAFRPAESVNRGWMVADAEKCVKARLRGALRSLRRFEARRSGPADARWYYLAPMLLDGIDRAKQWAECPEEALSAVSGDDRKGSGIRTHYRKLLEELERRDFGKMPEDLPDVLADIALGSPAVCALRAFAGRNEGPATKLALSFRKHLNSPEATAIVDYVGMRGVAHWRNVLRYAKNGCLSSVLAEWRHLLWSDVEHPPTDAKIADAMSSVLEFRSATYAADTFDAMKAWAVDNDKNGDDEKRIRFRTRFAAAFNKGEDAEAEGVNRREAVRAAFNSPFRPFVLASTSIGQEGLDFHRYCRKIFHWNLPSNPVDFEQREGRVDRYKGLSVRQSLAARFAGKRDFTPEDDIWEQLFAIARREAEKAGERSGLVPFWRVAGKAAFPVESIVPVLAFSRDGAALRRIRELLRVFRLALGQPRQEDLLDGLLRHGLEDSRVRELSLDLCPFSFRREYFACSEKPKMVQSSP